MKEGAKTVFIGHKKRKETASKNAQITSTPVTDGADRIAVKDEELCGAHSYWRFDCIATDCPHEPLFRVLKQWTWVETTNSFETKLKRPHREH
uniref:Uncharacterized protein n=1 Tax=Haemonchus contortus TaxID=6289 RepID=W6NXM2_HAECO